MNLDTTNRQLTSDNWYFDELIGFLKKISYLSLLAVVLSIHALYIVLWLYDLTFFAWLTKEGGVLEYASAVLLLLAGCVFLRGAFTTKSRFQKEWAVAFAAALIFMAGEEISWGQRIFGFNWEALENINSQNETNLHNLPLINTPRLLSIGSLLCGLVLLCHLAIILFRSNPDVRSIKTPSASSHCQFVLSVEFRMVQGVPYRTVRLSQRSVSRRKFRVQHCAGLLFVCSNLVV